MDYAKKYDDNLALIKRAANHEKTERIPTLSMAQTWAISYAGETAASTFTSVEKEFDVYSKHLHDIPFDGICLFGMNRPIPM